MSKDPVAKTCRLVMTSIKQRLPGFNHKGRKLWRVRADGLVDLVQLQTMTIGGVWSNRVAAYARDVSVPDQPTERCLAVNLGVWIPEVTRYEIPASRFPLVPEIAHCQAQARLVGKRADPPYEECFPVLDDPEGCARDVIRAWDDLAAAFFETYRSREDFLSRYLAGHWALSTGDTARDLLIMLSLQGRREEARAVLCESERELRELAERGHDRLWGIEVMRELAAELGVL